jgi:type I restriction enzyme, S subunit
MEGRDLPEGWEATTGSDVFELVTSGSRGWAKYYSDDGPLFIRIGNLDHDSIELDLRDVQHVSPPVGSEGKRTRLEPNDILISITAELGMVALVPVDLGEAYVNQHVALARPSSEIDPRFLAWYLASESDGKHQLLEAKRGATKVGLGLPDIRNLILPLAPLGEQRRIAAKLDTTLAAVDNCRQRLDGVTAILKRFRQALLAAATSGELTREWREETAADFDWPEVYLGDHAEGFSYGTSAKSRSEGEIPVLRMGNIQNGQLDWSDLVYTSDVAEIAKYMLNPGDVLFNRTNSPELVGKTAIFQGEQPAIYAGYLIRVRCCPSLDSEFLNLSLNSPAARDYCWKVKSDGVSQSNINAKKLAAYRFKLPLIEEQQEIVRRTQELFTLSEQLEGKLTSARKIVDRLTPALLAKAFRGELVPQDPNDEPASVLLQRIRANRQVVTSASGPLRRRRRSNRKGSLTNSTTFIEMLSRNDVKPNHLSAILMECGPLSAEALWSASQLEIDDFYDQLRDEESQGFLRESRSDSPNSPRLLEPSA